MRARTGAAVASVLLLSVLTGCGGQDAGDEAAAKKPATFDVKGELTLMDASVERNGGSCYSSSSGYSDLDVGGQVTIYDANGKAIALGALVGGLPPRDKVFKDIECVYPFTVKDVPVSAGPIYAVEVTHRGQIKFTQADASHLSISLGS